MTLCPPFSAGEPEISNHFPHEDSSVPELNKRLEPEDSKDLVLKKQLFLLFPVYFWVSHLIFH